ncbi:hypothetical protein PYCH_14770 [Pyrococcus yayanosii CH1]|uniref:Uncharacterized protein n=1 Tax=Pyrococcus yayanosii (strain CH1 / JCM 16557) TaxID=529709 RepID=F8AGF1_PYRYC|nr:hypothetical protein PYCH_14770 [Pyrococcus yayanosii CH1]
MRFLKVLAVFFLLLPGIMELGYARYSDKIEGTQPSPLTSRLGDEVYFISIFVPTSSLAEIKCVGEGDVVMMDRFSRKAVFYEEFSGKLALRFQFPHEGDYILYSENPQMGTTCVVRLRKNAPSHAVQRGMYAVGILSGLVLFGLLLWGKRT